MSSVVRGRRRMSASQRCSGCPSPTSPDRSVATTASRRGRRSRDHVHDRVQRRAVGPLQVVDHQHDGPLRAAPIEPGVEPAATNSPSFAVDLEDACRPASAMPRSADRIGRNGIDIEVSGRHAPDSTVDDADRGRRRPGPRARSCRRRVAGDHDRLRLARRGAVEEPADDPELIGSARRHGAATARLRHGHGTSLASPEPRKSGVSDGISGGRARSGADRASRARWFRHRSAKGRKHHEHRTKHRHLSPRRRPVADAGRVQHRPPRRPGRRARSTEERSAQHPGVQHRHRGSASVHPPGVCANTPEVDDNMSLRRLHEERMHCGIGSVAVACGRAAAVRLRTAAAGRSRSRGRAARGTRSSRGTRASARPARAGWRGCTGGGSRR